MVEFELLADTGLNRAEREAADQAKVDAEIAEDKAKADAAAKKAADAAAAPPATTPATVADTPPVTTTATTPPPAATTPTATTPTTGTVTPPVNTAGLSTKPSKNKGTQNDTPPKSILEQFDLLVTGAEKFVGHVFPGADDVTVEKMRQRVAGLMVVVEAATNARAAAAKTTVAA